MEGAPLSCNDTVGGTKGDNVDWKAFIRSSMADEEAAKAKYEQAAEAANTPAVKEVFRKLAYEEDLHYALLLPFEKDLESLAEGKK